MPDAHDPRNRRPATALGETPTIRLGMRMRLLLAT